VTEVFFITVFINDINYRYNKWFNECCEKETSQKLLNAQKKIILYRERYMISFLLNVDEREEAMVSLKAQTEAFNRLWCDDPLIWEDCILDSRELKKKCNELDQSIKDLTYELRRLDNESITGYCKDEPFLWKHVSSFIKSSFRQPVSNAFINLLYDYEVFVNRTPFTIQFDFDKRVFRIPIDEIDYHRMDRVLGLTDEASHILDVITNTETLLIKDIRFKHVDKLVRFIDKGIILTSASLIDQYALIHNQQMICTKVSRKMLLKTMIDFDLVPNLHVLCAYCHALNKDYTFHVCRCKKVVYCSVKCLQYHLKEGHSKKCIFSLITLNK
jgi:hypothetical protein